MKRISRTCGNCADFDNEKLVCTIRYTIKKDKNREPMKRNSSQVGCSQFLSSVIYRTQ